MPATSKSAPTRAPRRTNVVTIAFRSTSFRTISVSMPTATRRNRRKTAWAPARPRQMERRTKRSQHQRPIRPRGNHWPISHSAMANRNRSAMTNGTIMPRNWPTTTSTRRRAPFWRMIKWWSICWRICPRISCWGDRIWSRVILFVVIRIMYRSSWRAWKFIVIWHGWMGGWMKFSGIFEGGRCQISLSCLQFFGTNRYRALSDF